MKFLFSTLVFLSAISTYAADAGTRGGGNALICFNNPAIPAAIRKDKGAIKDEYISAIKSIQMLDLYELQAQRGMEDTTGGVSILPLKKGEKMAEFAERMLFRVKPFLPRFYSTAVKMMKEMPPEKAFAHEYGIQPVNDYELMGRIDSNNCVVGTVLFHKAKSNSLTEIHYDQRLWNHKAFNTYNKYVAYLHEVIYRTQREILPQLETSDAARSLVGQLISEGLTHEYLMQTQEGPRMMDTVENILQNPSECHSYYMETCNLVFGTDIAAFVNFVEANPARRLSGMNLSGSDQWYPKTRESFGSEYERSHPNDKNWTNIEKAYMKYLIDFRVRVFAAYRAQLQKILPEIKASDYMTEEDKALFISTMNKKLNPTQEEHVAKAEEYRRYGSSNWVDSEGSFLRANINWSKLVPFHGSL